MNEHIIMQGTVSPSLPHSLSFSCLSPRSPDYLPTYRASFVQVRKGKGGGGGEGEIGLPIRGIHRLKEKKNAEFYFFCVSN